ncbi:MAG TPA: energy transducer TonB [Hanamia sp.]|nr:energy transducer TonB [Hanamia sp.]
MVKIYFAGYSKNGNELISNKDNQGTCKVSFIVSKDGKVSNIIATTMKGTQLAEIAVNAIKKGPKWNPGMQNGQAVNSYVILPVTFALNDKITIKGEPE